MKILQQLIIWILLLNISIFAQNNKFISINEIYEIKNNSSIQLCARLSDYVYINNLKKAKTYISIEPKEYFKLSIDYNGICLQGLKARREYTIHINKNIPLQKFTLNRDYTLRKKTTDYKSNYNFKDHGYILPSKGDITIPIESMNVKELEIRLYRINSRNLMDKINKYGLKRAIYSYDLRGVANTDGYIVWSKKIDIKSQANISTITALPIGENLKNRESGVYILQALEIDPTDGKVLDEYNSVMQWFMISDIGVYTLRGDNGMKVYTRELSTTKEYNNVKLELIARNNEILYTTTSKNAEAFFPANVLNGKGGLSPKAIYAYGKNDDFSVLDLSIQPHDLSDRGVQGRNNPGIYDAFIYSSRGIFRPSELVPLHILVRDNLSNASAGTRLSLKVFDSKREEIYSKMLTTDESGYANTTLNTSLSTNRGKWSVELYAGRSKPIGKLSFLVENFIPPKIKIDIEKNIESIKVKEQINIKGKASYLNNIPLANANIEVETTLYQSKNPFNGYESYSFGDIQNKFSNTILETKKYKTGQNGEINIPFIIDKKLDYNTHPISALVTVAVRELGGRAVKKRMKMFLVDRDGYIGVKPNFENGAIDMNAKAKFEVVYLKESKKQNKTLNYRLIEEKRHWNWVSQGSSWGYEKSYSDNETIASGTIETSSDTPITIELSKLDWGSYRLEVVGENENRMLTSYRFTSGYEESLSKSSPDRLPVALDKQTYRLGETVKVHITAKFTGPAIISIANHSIVESKNIELELGKEKVVEFKVSKEWGSSTYVLATAFRPQSKKLGANRAIGLAHIKIVNPKKILELELKYEKRVKSSNPTTIKVKTINSATSKTPAQNTFLTLALVDDAVLRLTNYRLQSPKEYFFGQQKLGIEIRDMYSELIKSEGASAEFNVGAGDIAPMVLFSKKKGEEISNKREVVSIMTRVLKFDKSGEANITVDIPDYQGSLKLMAIAWNKDAIGSTSADMIIKDNISTEIYLPSFISVGDMAKSLLTVDFDENLTLGEYELEFTNKNEKQEISKKIFKYIFDGKASRFKQNINVEAPLLSDNTLTLEVFKDGVSLVKKEWKLAVRSKYPEVYSRKMGILNSSEVFDAKSIIDSSNYSGINNLALKISSKALLPTESISHELIAYSGRCAEQTTSRAFPLLFMSKKRADELGINRQEIIESAINRLANYQKLNGGFGLWSSSYASMWISSYVLDFLIKAKELGYDVPNKNINLGLKYLENNLNKWSENSSSLEADCYALYVLTKSGHTLMSEILHHTNSKNSKIKSAQAWGHLGVSLSLVGERKLAKEMFKRANNSLANNLLTSSYFSNYGGSLRDEASLVLLTKESELGLNWEAKLADLSLGVKDREYFSTQEMSLLLRVSSLTKLKSSKLLLTSNGNSLNVKNDEYTLKTDNLESLNKITNISNSKNWYTLSFQATPNNYNLVKNNGFDIIKKYFTINKEEINESYFEQGEKVVVVIAGKIHNSQIQNPQIVDWLPAGFELENPNISGIDVVTAVEWIKTLTPTSNISYKNDRYEAAINIEGTQKGVFAIAYIARVVTKGHYTLPPVQIEDMYKPRYRAVGEVVEKQIVIGDKSREIKKPIVKTISTKKLEDADYIFVNKNRITDTTNYTILQLNFLRNAIFAHSGFNFEKSNPMLHKLFSNFAWYHPNKKSSSIIYAGMSDLQKANIQILAEEERRRGGGLVLADFYRVNSKLLTKNDLKGYSKHQLFILRNSLFARRGVKFKNSELNEIFSYMPWYKPTDVSSSIVFDEQMSKQEKENIMLMVKMSKE